MINNTEYNRLLNDIKDRIQTAQIKANLAVNKELIILYWKIGYSILQKQSEEGWGRGIIPKLSKDLKKELPESKGFSERNLNYMLAFAREYGEPAILQQPVAKLEILTNTAQQIDISHLILQIPWGHNIIFLEKVKNFQEIIWHYNNTSIENAIWLIKNILR